MRTSTNTNTDVVSPLSRRDAQLALGVGETTVDKLIRDGRLKTFKIGRAVRIPRSEIQRYIESNTR